jgi:WD40 repeat protein
VLVWDAGSRLVGGGGPVNVVAFAGDGGAMLSSEPFSYAEPVPPDPAFPGGGDVLRWDTGTWTRIGDAIHGEYVLGLAVGPDGTWFAGGTVDGRVLRWPIDGGSTADETLMPVDDVLFGMVAVSPDEGTLVSGGFDDLHLWDAASGEVLRDPLPGYDNLAYGLAFSPNGAILATGDWEGRVRLWDTASWTPIEDPLAEGLQQVYAVGFDSTGTLFAAAGFDGSLIVWDTTTWERVRELAIDDALLSLAFSPDGRVLAVGTEAGEIRFIDVDTGQPIGGPVSGQRDWVNSVAFAPDGETLVAGSQDGSIALIPFTAWTDDISALADRLCTVAGRGMTEAEWDAFIDFRPYDPDCPRSPG